MNEYFLQNRERIVPDTDWMVGVALFTVLLFVISRLLFPRYHERLSIAFFNRYEAVKLMEERNTLFVRPGLMLVFVPVISLAICVFMQVSWFRESTLFDRPFLRFAGILAITLLFFGLRLLAVYLFGLAMNRSDLALRFNQTWMINFQYVSRIIIIPAIALPFLNGLLHTICLIMIWLAMLMWLIYTVYKEVQLLISSRVSIFFMILYLCTLEILPLWWAVKSIMEGW